MTLLDDFATVKKNLSECGISRMTKQLSTKESEALIKLIDDPDTSITSLARVLTKNGHEISRQTLNRHRNRGKKDLGCTCP